MGSTYGQKRPWRLERNDAGEDVPDWRVQTTFATEHAAKRRLAWLEAKFPGTYPPGRLRVEKHVEFEARS